MPEVVGNVSMTLLILVSEGGASIKSWNKGFNFKKAFLLFVVLATKVNAHYIRLVARPYPRRFAIA